MKKFIASAFAEEIYREILYITYHYQEEMIGKKEVLKLNDDDYKNLTKSKVLKNLYQDLAVFNDDSITSYLPSNVLLILEKSEYDEKNVLILIEELNPLISYYNKVLHRYIDDIAFVLDTKMKEKEYQGSYPLYLKILENSLSLERAVLSTTARSYLSKTTNYFGLKVTYVDYDIKLENYCYNGKDLREMERKEIVNYLDGSVQVNLEHAKYYETDIYPLKTETVMPLNTGEISIFLERRNKTYDGIKSVMKHSFKRTGITILVLIVVTIIILIIRKYL